MPGRLHHADIYRLDQLAEVADLALGELAEFNGIVLVEWGDVISAALGEHLEVRLEIVEDGTEADDDDAPPTARASASRRRDRRGRRGGR